MPAPHHSVFTGRMPFLPPNQQRQSTEGIDVYHVNKNNGEYILCLQHRIYLMFAFSERHVTLCHYNDKRSRVRLSL